MKEKFLTSVRQAAHIGASAFTDMPEHAAYIKNLITGMDGAQPDIVIISAADAPLSLKDTFGQYIPLLETLDEATRLPAERSLGIMRIDLIPEAIPEPAPTPVIPSKNRKAVKCDFRDIEYGGKKYPSLRR